MSKNTSSGAGEHFSESVETQAAKERCDSTASDVVEVRLRLLEGQAGKLAALRAALIAGERSGSSTPFDFEAFIKRKRAFRSPAL